jgi:hypothetical protein
MNSCWPNFVRSTRHESTWRVTKWFWSLQRLPIAGSDVGEVGVVRREIQKNGGTPNPQAACAGRPRRAGYQTCVYDGADFVAQYLEPGASTSICC